MPIKLYSNERGFNTGKFKDRNNVECSIQESSIATDHCIWLGVNHPDPKIMASSAHKYGIKPEPETTWVDYPIPKEVNLTTRMHLTRRQVADLLPLLQKFVETGEL